MHAAFVFFIFKLDIDLIQRYFHFFEKLNEGEAEDEAGGALHGVCREIYGRGGKAIEEALKDKISDRQEDFYKERTDDLRRKLSEARGEKLIDRKGDQRHHAFDHEGGGGINDIARKYICQGRADACGEKRIAGC